MVKKRITAYWLLLAFLLSVAAMILGVGETTARYDVTAQWSTRVEPYLSVSSKCLVPGGQFVLLGEMKASDGEKSIGIPIRAEEEMEVTLSCMSHSLWLEASLSSEELDLSVGTSTVYLNITLTEQAMELTEAVDADIYVELSCAEGSIFAYFRVTLLPGEEEDSEPEEETPSAGEESQNPEEGGETDTESSGTDDSAVTEPEESEPTTEDDTAAEPSDEENGSSGSASETPEATTPVGTPAPAPV